MALMELLTLRLGSALTKGLLQFWLRNSDLATNVAISVPGALETYIPNLLQRRRLRRELDEVAEVVAQKLLPLIEVEFRALPDNEKESAISAVADDVSGAGLTAELMVAKDIEPLQIEQHIRSSRPDACRRAALSSSACELYNLLLKVLHLSRRGSRHPPKFCTAGCRGGSTAHD